jgi:WhiB family transcriptional regulator, redox-sensing transcriptional regulator
MSGHLDWRRRAACRGADPELFFPEGTSSPALRAAAQAKQICAACPVRALCLDWALSRGGGFGIWGGRTEEERRGFPSLLARRDQEESHIDG